VRVKRDEIMIYTHTATENVTEIAARGKYGGNVIQIDGRQWLSPEHEAGKLVRGLVVVVVVTVCRRRHVSLDL